MNMNTSVIIITILLLSLFCVVYYSYSCFYPSLDQRIWDKTSISLPEYKDQLVFAADKIINGNEIFIVNLTNSEDFPRIVEGDEHKKLETDATNFFKSQFGLSDTFLNLFMKEVRVNNEEGYHVSLSKNYGDKKFRIVDGGYLAYIPAGKSLYGPYGGTDGVVNISDSNVVYGYYMIYDGDKLLYKIIYKSMCPIKAYIAYDASYTPIDCDTEIVQAPTDHTELVGLKGKARGVHIISKMKDALVYSSIRNVLIF